MSNRGMKKGGKQSLYLTIFEWQLPELKHSLTCGNAQLEMLYKIYDGSKSK